MHILEQAKSLLDFSQKLDISLLDGVVNLMYNEHGDMVKLIFPTTTTINCCFNFFFFLERIEAKTSGRSSESSERASGGRGRVSTRSWSSHRISKQNTMHCKYSRKRSKRNGRLCLEISAMVKLVFSAILDAKNVF